MQYERFIERGGEREIDEGSLRCLWGKEGRGAAYGCEAVSGGLISPPPILYSSQTTLLISASLPDSFGHFRYLIKPTKLQGPAYTDWPKHGPTHILITMSSCVGRFYL